VNHEGSYRCVERQALQTLFHEFPMVIGGQQLLDLVALVLDASEFCLCDSGIALESGLE